MLNCRGLISFQKRLSLTSLVSQSLPDIFLTETWFEKNIVLPNILLSDKYNIASRADPSNGLHGGTCILSKTSIAFTPVRTNENHICCASFSLSLPLLVCLSPSTRQQISEEYLVILSSLKNLIDKFEGHLILITSDFDEPHVDWDSVSCADPELTKFLDYLISCNFKQSIDEPTHIGGSILDLAFSNFDALRFRSLNVVIESSRFAVKSKIESPYYINQWFHDFYSMLTPFYSHERRKRLFYPSFF